MASLRDRLTAAGFPDTDTEQLVADGWIRVDGVKATDLGGDIPDEARIRSVPPHYAES